MPLISFFFRKKENKPVLNEDLFFRHFSELMKKAENLLKKTGTENFEKKTESGPLLISDIPSAQKSASSLKKKEKSEKENYFSKETSRSVFSADDVSTVSFSSYSGVAENKQKDVKTVQKPENQTVNFFRMSDETDLHRFHSKGEKEQKTKSFGNYLPGKGFFSQPSENKNYPKEIAVALSGGADSLCLTLLMQQWCEKNGYRLTAITIDHQLRKESAAEAQAVHLQLEKKGIRHQILVWKHPLLTSGIEEKAREARYGLLSGFCRQAGIPFLLTAHTKNDQAETFLLRLSKGSGPDGLAGIKPVFKTRGIVLIRPFLNFTKEEIIGFLKKAGQKWIEDPSNQNKDFARVRLRKKRETLEKMGLTLSGLAKSIGRLNETREFLEAETEKAVSFCAVIDPKGHAFIEEEKFFTLPTFLQKRVLVRLFFLIGGKKYAPSWEKTGKLLSVLPPKATLGGCLFLRRPEGIFICKEPARIEKEKALFPGEAVLWDRFFVKTEEKAVVSSLKKAIVKGIPAEVQKSWPAFYSADGKKTLLSIPSLDRSKEKPHFNESRKFECVFLNAFDFTQERWKQDAETK